jgi:hypothetical protein
MNKSNRWLVIVGALLLAAVVGFWAFQAGVEHGIEQSGKIVVAPLPTAGAYPYPYPYYGWHRPWGFGIFGPLFFIAFWLVLVRGVFWRRRLWYAGHGGGCGPYGRFEEWHRQAHERERDAAAAGAAGER